MNILECTFLYTHGIAGSKGMGVHILTDTIKWLPVAIVLFALLLTV